MPPFYDSLLAKLIVWDADRDEAIARSERALREFEIEGSAHHPRAVPGHPGPAGVLRAGRTPPRISSGDRVTSPLVPRRGGA